MALLWLPLHTFAHPPSVCELKQPGVLICHWTTSELFGASSAPVAVLPPFVHHLVPVIISSKSPNPFWLFLLGKDQGGVSFISAVEQSPPYPPPVSTPYPLFLLMKLP